MMAVRDQGVDQGVSARVISLVIRATCKTTNTVFQSDARTWLVCRAIVGRTSNVSVRSLRIAVLQVSELLALCHPLYFLLHIKLNNVVSCTCEHTTSADT